jgi:L-iditol 2-dehydrogenase
LRTTNFYPGGFAEYVRLPKENVKVGTLKITANVSDDDATFVEPLGCVLRGQRLAGGVKGKRVLVIGSGISGLLHVKAAKASKAKGIIATDVDPFRLEMAKKFGASFVLDAREDVLLKVKEHFQGRLADLVILCTGNDSAIRQGLKSVERGGTALIFTAAGKDAGFPLSINQMFWRTDLTIVSSYAASPDDLKEALKAIASQKIVVKDMITHYFGLESAHKGFELVYKPNRSLKVIIKP